VLPQVPVVTDQIDRLRVTLDANLWLRAVPELLLSVAEQFRLLH
jgi:hypothetical protein